MAALASVVAGVALAGAAGGAVLTRARADARARRAEAAHPPEGQFVTVAGAQVHAVVRGHGPDLVLIHGASGSVRDMTFALVDRLAARFRVIALDRPGFGWSQPIAGGVDITVQARHLAAAARALGATRPLVLGHSYGGAVALAWAVALPDAVAGLVLVASPSHPWPDPLPPLYRLTAGPAGVVTVPLLSAFVPRAMVRRATAQVFAPQPAPAGYAAWFGPEMSVRRASFRLNAQQRAALKPAIAALVPAYGRLRLPVEAVHGTADATVPMDIHALPLTRKIAGLNLARLDGQGHMIHQTAPQAVADAVDRAAARAGLI